MAESSKDFEPSKFSHPRREDVKTKRYSISGKNRVESLVDHLKEKLKANKEKK
jgi:hypothetical protein